MSNTPIAEATVQPQSERVVFCDFDGTITSIDTFVGMAEKLIPEMTAQILPQLYARTLTLRAGVRQLLSAIASGRYGEILDYVQTVSVRPGLEELLEFLEAQAIPVVVVSGGLKGMVETVLSRRGKTGKPLLEKVTTIFAADVDASGEYLQVISPWENETELVAKAQIMDLYSAQEKIAIGDSVTDINMALKADLTFARDRLTEYLAAENHSYIPWCDFFEVRDYLQKHLQSQDQMRYQKQETKSKAIVRKADE